MSLRELVLLALMTVSACRQEPPRVSAAPSVAPLASALEVIFARHYDVSDLTERGANRVDPDKLRDLVDLTLGDQDEPFRVDMVDDRTQRSNSSS